MIDDTSGDDIDPGMEEFLEREFGNTTSDSKWHWVVWLFASIPIALVIVGFYLVYAGGTVIATAFQTSNWPSVSGTVTVCEVREYIEGGNRTFSDEYKRYSAELLYEYSVDGVDFENSRIAIGQSGVKGRGEAVRRLEPYSVGAEVTVYYDASEPGESCLVHGATGSAYMLLVAGLVMVVLTVRMSLSWMKELGVIKESPDDSKDQMASVV